MNTKLTEKHFYVAAAGLLVAAIAPPFLLIGCAVGCAVCGLLSENEATVDEAPEEHHDEKA